MEKRDSGPEFTPVICPQCGSQDIELVPGVGVGTCRSCGTQLFVFQEDDDSDQDDVGGGPTVIYIPAKYSDLQCRGFILDVLAGDDSPIDVFDGDFNEPIAKKMHTVLQEIKDGEAHVTASVGYDRQEPYLETERYYDSNYQGYRTRQVTKYKTVTDWHPFSDTVSVRSVVHVDNDCDPDFSESLFDDCLVVSEGKRVRNNGLRVNANAVANAEPIHSANIKSQVYRAIPGDRHKDVRWNASVSTDRILIKVPCNYMSFVYKGVRYKKRVFPIGKPVVGGDQVHGGADEASVSLWKELLIPFIIICAVLIMNVAFFKSFLAAVGFGFLSLVAYSVYEYYYYRVRKRLVQAYKDRKAEVCKRKKKSMGL